MSEKSVMDRISAAADILELIEANGRIDGMAGKDCDKGWIELCQGMGTDPFNMHRAYRTAYENGWFEGNDESIKKFEAEQFEAELPRT